MRIVCFILIAAFLFYTPEAKTEETPQKSLAKGCVTGDVTLVREAIKSGANVNEEFATRMPLYFATDSNHLNAVTLLVEKGAEIDHLNGPAGRSALHQATIKGYFEILKFLVESGANINIRNTHGRTPLDYAIAAKRTNAYDGATADSIIHYLTRKGGITSGSASLVPNNVQPKKDTIGSSSIAVLLVDHLGQNFLVSVIWTWLIGLFPSLLIRFVLLKRPLSTWPAFFVAALFWALQFASAVALKTSPKSHSALFFVGLASFYILRGVKLGQANNRKI